MNLIIIGIFLVNNRLGEYVVNMDIADIEKICYYFVSRPNNLGAHITVKTYKRWKYQVLYATLQHAY